jgi:hypothetical protein
MTAESLSVARAERMNRNTGIFFNVLEKVGTENNFSDTPGNIFNFDDSGIQINNKPDSVIAEKGSVNVHVLTLGEKSEKYHSGSRSVSAPCSNIRDRQQETGVR